MLLVCILARFALSSFFKQTRQISNYGNSNFVLSQHWNSELDFGKFDKKREAKITIDVAKGILTNKIDLFFNWLFSPARFARSEFTISKCSVLFVRTQKRRNRSSTQTKWNPLKFKFCPFDNRRKSMSKKVRNSTVL